MISPTSPSGVERPDFRLLPEDVARYLRVEFGEETVAWLLKEDPPDRVKRAIRERKQIGHVRYALRGLASKVASLLF